MASLVWRADRKRWYSYFVKDGKHRGRVLSAAPRRKKLLKAERAEAAYQAERIARREGAVSNVTLTLKEAADLYLTEVRVGVRRRTFERYVSTIRQFAESVGREKSVHTIGPADVRCYRDERLAKRAARTVCNDLKCLNAMFAWLYRQRDPATRLRWIEDNPAEDVRRPVVTLQLKYFPSTKEILRLLAALRSPGVRRELYALGLFGAYAGMRRSEVLELRVDHVDLDRRLLRVWGKSKHPRPIPMHSGIFDFLTDWPLDDEYVFPCLYHRRFRGGKPYGHYMGHRFNVWLKTHGYPFTHKALRHWFNDQLRQCPGLSPDARILIVGHEDLVTNRIYSNPQAEEARPFVELLGRQ